MASKNANCRQNFVRHRITDFMKKCEKVHLAPDITPITKKSSKQSTEWRNEGNKMYPKTLSHDNLEYVLTLYNKSIAFAPKSSNELSLAYANESAVLFRLDKFDECLQTIESCLSLNNYPEQLKLKLFLRKTECLCKLNRKREAKIVFAVTQNWIKENVPAEAQLEKLNQLNKSFKEEPVKQKIVANFFDRVVKDLNCSKPNKEVPALADAVALKYDDKYGRHFVATRYIKPGEIIGREKLYSKTLLVPRMYSHCWNCAYKVWHCIPCEHCVNVIFCSEKCREEAWKSFHDVECEVLKDLMNVDNDIVEWICIFVAGFQNTIRAVKQYGNLENLKEEIIKIDKCKDPRIKGFSKDGFFRSDSFRSYYTLCNLAERSTNTDCTMTFQKLGSFAAYILATKTTFFGAKINKNWSDLYTNENVVFMSQLVAKNVGIFSYNAYYILEVGSPKGYQPKTSFFQVEYDFLVRKINFDIKQCSDIIKVVNYVFQDGSEKCRVISPALSLLNHSCYSNVEIFEKDYEYYALAMRSIKKGEQIYIPYIDVKDMTKDIRRSELWKKYEFVCECMACKNDWPLAANYPLLKDSELTYKIRLALNLVKIMNSSCNIQQKINFETAMHFLKAGFDALESVSSCTTTAFKQAQVLRCAMKDFFILLLSLE